MNKNRYILAITASLAVAIVLAATTVFFYNKKVEYERTIEMANRRSFSQLTTSLSSIDSNLQKLQYAANGPTFATITANIWRESEVAKYALAAIPLEDARLERFEMFIAQAGDYAFSLMKSAAGGTPSGDEARESLKSLSAVAAQLAVQMNELQERLDADDTYIQMRPGTVSMSKQPAGVSQNFSQTEEEFPEYATLIYDGPFSDHVRTLTPQMLEGLADVSQQEAMEAARKFLDTDSALKLAYEGEGLIPYYAFSYDSTATIEVSKVGGVVLALTNTRDLGTGKLNVEQALELAHSYLAQRGYEDMKTSYYTVFENIITINFAATVGDVIIYPDLIKVGIALDDGGVVRFDAAGYIMNHREREAAAPALSTDDVWADIPPGLEVISENVAIIPTSGKNEVLCYEFVCKDAEGHHVILYINAQTGLQENVFLLIEDENGVLTI